MNSSSAAVTERRAALADVVHLAMVCNHRLELVKKMDASNWLCAFLVHEWSYCGDEILSGAEVIITEIRSPKAEVKH